MKKFMLIGILVISMGVLVGCSKTVSQLEYDTVITQKDTLQIQLDSIKGEKEKLQEEFNTIKKEKDKLQEDYEYSKSEYDKCKKELDAIYLKYEKAVEEKEKLESTIKDTEKPKATKAKSKVATYSDDILTCKYDETLLEPELQGENEIISYALLIKKPGELLKDIYPSKTYLLAGSMYNTMGFTLDDFKEEPEESVYNFSTNFMDIDEDAIKDYKINDLLDKNGTLECIFTLSDNSICKFKFLLINKDELTYTACKLLSSEDSEYTKALSDCYESISVKK